MDAKLQSLPPLKRFRFRQPDLGEPEAPSSSLPAKKRKESRVLSGNVNLVPPANNFCCLPAKKRILALPPEVISGVDFSAFDLNVEYLESRWNWEANKENIPPQVNESVHPFEKDDKKKKRKKKNLHVKWSSPIENTSPAETETLGLESSDQLLEAVQNCGESETEINQLVQEDEEPRVEEEDDGISCAVCESTDGNPSDPIVFCDGCDVMVHARCYGNPLINNIPEGDWFCSQCLASNSSSSVEKKGKPFSCCLCPINGGAMKPTNDGRWAHVVCAVFVPEVFFEDPEGREGIDCSMVPKRRWEGKCYACSSRKGCVIECSESKCRLAFHVTCALKADLCIEYREGKKGTVIAGFCKTHTELWKKVAFYP